MTREFDTARPYIVLGYLRGLFDYLRFKGAAIAPVLEVMKLKEEQLRDPDIRVDHSLQNNIFDVAEELTGDVNIGLHAGESTHLIHFGIGGQLAMTCQTVRELVDLHSRFQKLLSTGARIEYIVRGDEVVGEATFIDKVPPSRHNLEYALASHTALTRVLTGVPFAATRIEMPYPQPEDCSEQQRLFNCPIRYGCERERIYFPADLLDVPLVVGDSDSRRALELEARRRLDAINVSLVDENPQIAGIKRFIADRLKGGEPPSVEAAAEALGLSVRTLQRRLEAVRVNYRDLIDLVRRELAEEYMGDSSLTQVDIAFLLGYSEQSTFNRAFRRWFEMTPREYRALGSKRL